MTTESSTSTDDSFIGMLTGTKVNRQKYSRIFSSSSPSLDTDALDSSSTAKKNTRKNIIIYVLATISTFLLLFTTSLLITPSTFSISSPSSIKGLPPNTKFRSLGSCGTNATTARANGCVFDVMSILWVQPACFDKSLTDEFNEQYSAHYPWYRWGNLTEQRGYDPVPLEEVERGEWSQGLWVDWRYHQLHCTFGWRKMHRALLKAGRGGALDDTALGYGHTVHCEDMLVNWGDSHPGMVNTRVSLGYSECLEIIP